MKIESLNLIGFGKFNNENIELEDGINILYGENEAGKTTIHNFVNGMFYGFLRPYVKRTLYLDEHEKYEPWSGKRYSGTIDFIKDGERYRIEREFTRGNEKTSVFLRDTGENITKRIDVGDGGRVLQPGFHFFGFNDTVYNNTISIRQLESETEDDLANEVRDKLANLSATMDEDISVDNAVDNLEQRLKDIGTERAQRSPYGKTSKDIENLKERRKDLYLENEEYKKVLNNSTSINEKIIEKEKILKELNKNLDLATKFEKKKIYDDVNNLIKEIEKIEKELEKLVAYKEISIEDYSYVLELTRDIDNTEKRIKELKEEINIIKEEIILYEKFDNGNLDENSILIEDYIKVEELDDKKNKLELERSSLNTEYLKREYEEIGEENKLRSLPIIVLIFISSIITSILTKNLYLLLLNLIILPILYLSKKEEKTRKEKSKRIVNDLEIIKRKDRDLLLKVKEIEELQNLIFIKYKVKSKIELKRLSDTLELEIIQKRSQKSEYDNRKSRIDRGEENLNNLVETLNSLLERRKKYLLKNRSKNANEFKENLEKKNRYDDLLSKLDSKIELKNNRLGEEKLEELKIEINNIDFTSYEYKESSQEIKENIDSERDLFNNIKIEQNVMEEKINRLNKGVKDLLELEESIERLETELSNMDIERKSLELAKNTILDLSKDIHREFAPTINKRIGKIVNSITNGRYTKVKIDDELNIGVLTPNTNEIINISSLSGGTMDQLYFALRFGIIDEIKNSSLPLILDDCFIQYDDNRLDKMMDFLIEESKNRQIILFTCHNREKKVLKEKIKDINIIEL